jgi:hypothetical protein
MKIINFVWISKIKSIYIIPLGYEMFRLLVNEDEGPKVTAKRQNVVGLLTLQENLNAMSAEEKERVVEKAVRKRSLF